MMVRPYPLIDHNERNMKKPGLLVASFLCLLLSGCSGDSGAPHWMAVDETERGKFLVDSRSIVDTNQDDLKRITLRFDENADSPENERQDAAGSPRITMHMMVVQYDCASHTETQVSVSYKFANNPALFPRRDAATGVTVPIDQNSDALDEKIIDYVCLPKWRRWFTNQGDSL